MFRETGIICSDIDALRERCFIYETEVINQGSVKDDPRYESSAIVPAGDWRQPSVDELLPYMADSSTADAGGIEIIGFTARARDFISSYAHDDIATTECATNQLTTTVNTRTNLRTGLHLDSKQHLPMHQRLSSPRRIAFNRGPGHRYLLIGSANVFSIAKYAGLGPEDRPTTGEAREYARAHAIGGIAVRLAPREGYVAPTELQLHCGSTYDEDTSTVSFWIDDSESGWPTGHFGTII